MRAGQVERVTLQRLEHRRLAPAPIGQELSGFEPVGVAAGFVAGDSGGPGKALWPTAAVARLTRAERTADDPC
jgi:hypothetical protein